MLKKEVSTELDATGRPIMNYIFDGSDGMEGVLFTGPVRGSVTLSDGTSYDLTPEVIEHLPGHAGPLCHHIERRLEESGQLGLLRADPVHTCTEACGSEAD